MPPEAPGPIAIRPCEGRRVILHDGGRTLDGLAIAPDGDLPAAGAWVNPGIWVHTRVEQGDAEPVPAADLEAGARAAAEREQVASTTDDHGTPA